MAGSLWGDTFAVPSKSESKKLIEKVTKPKKVTVKTEKTVSTPRASKNVLTPEIIKSIEQEVNRVLGKYKEQTVVLRSKEELHEYIDAALINSAIALDTETNNSLQPITCKIMGLCLYTPGKKNAYIPVNHVNLVTGELLPNQVTEEEIHDELERLVDTKIIMHNGKFDYQVVKCTCKNELKVYWDTMIGARILDENERASLKQQYIMKIDPSIEKYSIEQLFEGFPYAQFPPELFALYAATDAYMTYRLYEWQKAQFELPGNERLFNLFMNIEMPMIPVLAAMELKGVSIDTNYAKRLSVKYHKKLDVVDKKIEAALHEYDQVIAEWRKTPEANHRDRKVNKKGEESLSRSKSEQLSDPVSVTSPTQLAILFYDVLKCPVLDKKSPRGTGEELLEKMEYPICKLILEKRGLEKLIGTYIDKLPECVLPQTGRIHAHFNQIGADTGRQSSSDPNLQNIPSKNKDIRMLFSAGYNEKTEVVVNNSVTLEKDEQLFTSDGWKSAQDLEAGNIVVNDEEKAVIDKIDNEDKLYHIYLKEVESC